LQRRVLVILAFALAVLGGPAIASPTLAEPAVRAFLARQDRAWSKGDLAGYFATFAPDAVFVDQAQNPRGGVLPYGRSTLAEAHAQARRSLKGATARQETVIERLQVATDGRSARVVTRDTSAIQNGGHVRRACGVGEQTLTVSGGRLVSHGLTETAVRCPR
jgi:uncharacterized protein (TIGR02246 family)